MPWQMRLYAFDRNLGCVGKFIYRKLNLAEYSSDHRGAIQKTTQPPREKAQRRSQHPSEE